MSLPDFLPPIAPLPTVGTLSEPLMPTAAGVAIMAPTVDFSQLVVKGLEQVNDSLLSRQTDMQRLAAGDVGNLHQTMLKLEESRLSFQLMLQVRNRLLESYQELMRTQV